MSALYKILPTASPQKRRKHIVFVLVPAISFWLALFPFASSARAEDNAGGSAVSTASGVGQTGEDASQTGQTASGPEIPQPGEEFYYLDQAGVLSQETRSAIVERNQSLNEKYGVQLVVFTSANLPVAGYAQRVEYLRSVMSRWQVGGAGGRGLILALSIGDEDYLAVAGAALQGEFTSQALKALLDAQLEPDFGTKSYDAGVGKFFAAAADKAEAYCAANPEAFAPDSTGGEGENASVKRTVKKSTGNAVLMWVGIVAGAVAVVSLAIFVLAGRSGGRRRSSRRGVHRGSPIITPPRSNVLRHEFRPTVQIKSSRQTTGVYRNQKPTRTDRRS